MFCVNVWPRQTLHPLLLGSISSSVGITVLTWAISAGQINTIYGMMALTGYGVGIRLSPASMHGLAYFPASTAAITSLFSFAVPFGGMIALTTMSTVFNNRNEVDPKDGVTWAFVSVIPFVWLCAILTTFLGNVWVRKKGDHEVVNGAYFWSFFTRKTLQKERRSRDGACEAISRTDTQAVVSGDEHRDAQTV